MAKHNNNGDSTQRIGIDFNRELEEIKDTRKDDKRDKFRRSTREITDQLIKHSHWPEIKRDLTHFNFRGGEDEEG